MRRTVGLLVTAFTLVGAAGVAFAAHQPAGGQPAETDARPPAATVVRPDQQGEAVQRIGAIEQVDGLLARTGRLVGAKKEVTYSYPGASYVKVHVSRALLRPGDKVVVRNPSGTESYSYTGEELDGQWAMSISGDTAVMRLEQGSYDPLGLLTSLAGLGVAVDRVARGFGDDASAPAPDKPEQDRSESICGSADEKRDAVCYKSQFPVQYQKSKAVARLLINGVELCTAWRVGPNNRMFTNNHCISTGSDVRHSEVWFNYECARCGGFEVLRPTKVSGDDLIATDRTLDYALFSVRNFSAVQQFGFLDLDPRPLEPGEPLYIPQHPQGDPTMIAMRDPEERGGNCVVDNPEYYGYDSGTDVSYYCDTEGGSSGSPVLSATNHKVIALHHFGGCPNSGVRIDLIYDEVAGLL